MKLRVNRQYPIYQIHCNVYILFLNLANEWMNADDQKNNMCGQEDIVQLII